MAMKKSTNNIVDLRFIARTSSRIRRIVKICDVVDRFLRKPFWFFQSIFSILGSMRLHSWALKILVAMDVTTLVVLGYSEITLLRKREDAPLYPSVHCVLVIYITASEQYVIEFPDLPYFWGYIYIYIYIYICVCLCVCVCVWTEFDISFVLFCFVSLFNGISIFVSYSMPKLPSRKTPVMLFNPYLEG